MKTCKGCSYLIECFGSWPRGTRFKRCHQGCSSMFITFNQEYRVTWATTASDCWRYDPAPNWLCPACRRKERDRRAHYRQMAGTSSGPGHV